VKNAEKAENGREERRRNPHPRGAWSRSRRAPPRAPPAARTSTPARTVALTPGCLITWTIPAVLAAK
jgi:hypothetical protein